MTVAARQQRGRRGKEGVVVTEVDPKARRRRGFKEGDVHSQVARERRYAATCAMRSRLRAATQNSVPMRVKTADSRAFVAVPLAKG